MTKDVTFRIKLQTDAKGVTSATMSVEELNRAVKAVGDSVKATTGFWMSFGKVAMSIEATSNLINKVNGQIKELASSYNTFDTAMRSANTMMGLGEDVFLQMRESISDLSKEIPNGLERCHGEKEYMRMKSILYTHYIIIIISTYKT